MFRVIGMSRILATLFVVLALPALGQPTPGAISRGDLMKLRQYQTAGTVAMFVETTGSDANACTSVGAPCLTIQGALNKIPKRFLNTATVTVGLGNFAGAIIENFSFNPTQTAYLLIIGTRANVVPTTGSATGTATSGAAGSGTTYGTLTDTGATWTINDFRGQFINVLTGTGSGQVKMICSNTATVITICGTWTAPAAASTYAVQTTGTLITSAPTQAATYITSTTSTGSAFVITHSGPNMTNRVSGSIILQDIGISINATIAVNSFSQMMVSTSRVRIINTAARCWQSNNANVVASDSYCLLSASGIGFFNASNGFGTVTGSLVVDGVQGMYGGGGSQSLSTTSTMLLNQTTTAWDIYGCRKCFSTNDTLTGPGSGTGIGISVSTSNPTDSNILMNGSSVSSYATGVAASSPLSTIILTATTGTGNTTAITVSRGAKVQLGSTTTLTGTTEVTFDGVNYTLAAIRALSPIQLTGPTTLSTIYE